MASIRRNINVFGSNTLINTTTIPEDIWRTGGTYTGFPTGSPETIQVFSDNTNDTSAGTGARTIRIEGLRSNTSTEYETEDITLNGVTAVTSTNTWYRINRSWVLTAGNTGWNVGTITIRHSTTTANVFGTIQPTSNQSAMAVFTIPFGRTGFLNKYSVSFVRTSGAAGSGRIGIRVRENGGVFRIRDLFEISTSAPLSSDLQGEPIELPALTDIKITVESVSDNNSAVSGSFNITYS